MQVPCVLISLAFALLQCHLTTAVASDAEESILQTDDQGRLHIAANDVMILNASFRGLLNQLHLIATWQQQEIQSLSQQVADLRQDVASRCACATNNTHVKFNATAARQIAKLVASDGVANDRFGFAVAATDSMVVVGAHGDDDQGIDSGSVYVSKKNSTGQYELVSKLVASDGVAGDYFGIAVAATDDVVVVGAWLDDDNGIDSGSVYVFEKNSTGQHEQVRKLVASDGVTLDYFGRAVAATDDMVVVGAYGDDDRGTDSGSVYVFEKNGTGQYEQVSKLVASDGATGDQFGFAVAVADDMVVVGAQVDDHDKGLNSGSVYVFEKNGTGQYEQVSKLVASDGAAGDNFGEVAAATGMVVVGAQVDDGINGIDSGSVYVFEKNGTGQYEQVSKLVAGDGAADDFFGNVVAVIDGMVVVGAYRDDDIDGIDSGSVYVFENSTGQYEQVRKLVVIDGAAGAFFNLLWRWLTAWWWLEHMKLASLVPCTCLSSGIQHRYTIHTNLRQSKACFEAPTCWE
jgi:hypothetical protein